MAHAASPEAPRLTKLLPRELRAALVEFLPEGQRFVLCQIREFSRLPAIHASRVPQFVEFASFEGNLELLKWFFSRKPQAASMALLRKAAFSAARGGHLMAVRWIHSKGVRLHAVHLEYASRGGSLQLLQWLLGKIEPSSQATWDRLLHFAVERGHTVVSSITN